MRGPQTKPWKDIHMYTHNIHAIIMKMYLNKKTKKRQLYDFKEIINLINHTEVNGIFYVKT